MLSAVVLVAVSVAISGLAVWNLMRADSPGPRPIRFALSIPTPERLGIARFSADVAVSPDGQHVAYITGASEEIQGPKQLRLQSLRELMPTTLVDTGTPLYGPFFHQTARGWDSTSLRRESLETWC